MSTWDTIIIGLGGMGAATAYQLARRGQRVLGLEQYRLGHALGSSHGQTRIIRQAYFEHPDYVPLLRAAYRGWDKLAADTDREIVRYCGIAVSGREEDTVIRGMRTAAEQHDLPLDVLSVANASKRFPHLRFAPDSTVLFDPMGGYVRVEACVRAQLAQAQSHGAVLHDNEPVVNWLARGNHVEVTTTHAVYRAERLVICAGAWADRLLASLHLPLTVRRVVTAWYPADHPGHDPAHDAPVFGFQTPDGFFYGFPAIDNRGVKVACHEPGIVVSDPAGIDRVVSDQDLAPIRHFAKQHVPDLRPGTETTNVCLYTMSPDGHFIVDRHPEYEQVFFAAGFSGHGFKFCPAIGAILADRVVDGRTSLPASFLGLRRLNLSAS